MLPVTASAMVRPRSALMPCRPCEQRLLELDDAHRLELPDQLERFGRRHRAYVEDLLERLHTVDMRQEEARAMIDGELRDLLHRLLHRRDAVPFGQRELRRGRGPPRLRGDGIEYRGRR